jgi:hypothetical protein
MEPIFDHENSMFLLEGSCLQLPGSRALQATPLQMLPGLPIFSKSFRNRQSHAGASWLINSIERPYPFCSTPPKETENARVHKEPDTSMTPAAQPLECAACLDASVAKRITKSDRICPGKELLARIVAMLTRLVERFDPDEFQVREDGIKE